MMDPTCLWEWEWQWIWCSCEGERDDGSDMLGRVSDVGCGRVRGRISRGDAKPLKRSDPQPPTPIPVFDAIPNQIFVRCWRLGIGSFQGLCIPPTNSLSHPPTSTITHPTKHVGSIISLTLTRTSDPLSPHETITNAAWKVGLLYSGQG